jgi:VPDSG-CTERM motif
MKTLQITALGAIVALGLTCGAKANIITPLPKDFTASNPSGPGYDTGNQNEASILATANANGVDGANGDLSVDVRLTSAGTVTNTFGTFTVTEVSTGVEDFSFSLNPGFVLAGLSLHDGAGNIVNLYSINDETSGTNEGPVNTPFNASGSEGGLSNFDFLLEAAPNIPDGGTTVMLLGTALAGLGLLRRFLAA